jgi:hypothetical protein
MRVRTDGDAIVGARRMAGTVIEILRAGKPPADQIGMSGCPSATHCSRRDKRERS